MNNDDQPARPRQLGVFEDRIVTVPNLISLVRLGCIPVFLWLLFSLDDRFSAALLWGVVGATDWVDGWWARRFDVVSEFGKLIDPVTDRAVLIVGILAVGIDGGASARHSGSTSPSPSCWPGPATSGSPTGSDGPAGCARSRRWSTATFRPPSTSRSVSRRSARVASIERTRLVS